MSARPRITSLSLRPGGLGSSGAMRSVELLIAGAWLAAALLQVTGHAAALHHHTLIEGADGRAAPPLWLAIPAFLLGWQLMIAAMMLPASVRAVSLVGTSRLVSRPVAAVAGFLGAYSLVWTGFGVAAFAGDIALHHLVDGTPWLAERPWLVEAASLALAGAYQLLPRRRRALDACRHPRGSTLARASDAQVGFRVGLAHAADCLGASWALMLLMFAAGVANLAWMAVLAGVMAYEALGRHGPRFGIVVGLVLLVAAGATATGLSLGV